MSPRIGLVLGSGGATGGAFHAGVLAAIRDRTGWDARTADIIIGTSAGSITGASLRSGLSPDDLFNRATGQPVSAAGRLIMSRVRPGQARDPEPTTAAGRAGSGQLLRSYARRPQSLRLGGLAAAVLPTGRASTAGIADSVAQLARNRWPDEPLWAVSMRLTDGRRMVYGSGSDSAPIGSAVAASCAIPGYFAPVPINGANHVDGGMYSAANLDLLADYDLDLVIVSAPMATHSAFTKTLDLPLRQFLLRQLAGEAKAVRAAGSRVVVFAPTPADISVMGINPMAPGREGPVARQVRTSTSDRIRQQNLLPGLAP